MMKNDYARGYFSALCSMLPSRLTALTNHSCRLSLHAIAEYRVTYNIFCN